MGQNKSAEKEPVKKEQEEPKKDTDKVKANDNANKGDALYKVNKRPKDDLSGDEREEEKDEKPKSVTMFYFPCHCKSGRGIGI